MRPAILGFVVLGLVYTPGCTKPDPPPPLDAKASPALNPSTEHEFGFLIEREDQGHAAVVTPNFEFRSGDRFRLRLRPGFPAYVYVVNRGSKQATCRVLFPVVTEQTKNPLRSNSTVNVPIDTDWLRLDQSPGNEYLTLIASTVALPELEKSAQIPRDTFDAQLANIDRAYQPVSSSRIRDGDWTKYWAARNGDLALVVRLALLHD